ncbi:SPOR domain-containing protein [Limibaculum sp. M0105]|uniref:SPOR domain-containing protein n=1 Tax=Thermohalobaculum xanthum TaxID=2753746 RepID=A0A8J7M539_9RHOB|nr:SPOR domain-containing protein [Thermohalobaculum xanthum]MBK0398496.1 SPOR domain-containing protein [Thermohalobaculum xanthum]
MSFGTAGSAGAMRRLFFVLLASGLTACEAPTGTGQGEQTSGQAIPDSARGEPASEIDQATDAFLAKAADRPDAPDTATAEITPSPGAPDSPAPDTPQDPGEPLDTADIALDEDGASAESAPGTADEAAQTDGGETSAEGLNTTAAGDARPDGAAAEPSPDDPQTTDASAPADASADEAVASEAEAEPEVEKLPELPPVDPALYAGDFDGRLNNRLELAPDVFAAQGEARWNGTRTIAGIWVAHPAARRTTRARIFNLSTGRAADGALFRREGMAPDVPLQISSEGAQALGMRVNRSADIVIVALREPALPEPSLVESAPVVRLEIEPPEGTDITEPTPEAGADQPKVEPASAATETPRGAASAETEEPAVEPAGEVSPPASAARPSEDSVAAKEGTPETPAVREDAARPTAPDSEAEPARPDAGATAPETDRGPAAPVDTEEEGASTNEPAPAPSDLTPAARTPTRDTVNFIQVGIFAVRENSDRLVAQLADADIKAQAEPIDRSGRVLLRVIAGPFGNEIERDRALRVIEDLGIRDARLIRE